MKSTNSFNAIMELNLDPIKVKLMHLESGEGWSREQADTVETEYRRFLYLVTTFPSEPISPLVDVDTFWHYHILDTMKYAADCEQAFGYFVHHFPYIGMRGEEDEKAHHQGGERMRELYHQTFGESYSQASDSVEQSGAAFCGATNAKSAFCGATGAKAAFCGATSAKSAFCGATGAKAAFCGATGAKVAFCGATSAKAAFCGATGAMAAFCGAANTKTAFCGATNAKTAFCGATNAKTAFCGATGAKAAFCGATSLRPASLRAAGNTPVSYVNNSADFYTARPLLAAA